MTIRGNKTTRADERRLGYGLFIEFPKSIALMPAFWKGSLSACGLIMSYTDPDT